MKKVFAVIALLAVLAVPVMAGPVTGVVSTLSQASWNDTTDTLTVALYYSGPGTQAGQFINSFASEMTLNGTEAGLFTPLNPSLSAAGMQSLITSTVGGTYALSGLTGVTVSNNYGDGSTSFEVQATSTTPPANEVIGTSPLTAGNILAIFQFSYAASGKTSTQIKALGTSGGTLLPQVVGLGAGGAYDVNDLDDTGASFLGGATAGSPNTMDLLVTNNNTNLNNTGADANNLLPVPEPATMGLLGLGLVGLVTRRKKA